MLNVHHQIDKSLSNFLSARGITFPYIYDSIAMLPFLAQQLCLMKLPSGQTALNMHKACEVAKSCEMMLNRHVKRELVGKHRGIQPNIRLLCVHQIVKPGVELFTFVAYRSKHPTAEPRSPLEVELLGTTLDVAYH